MDYLQPCFWLFLLVLPTEPEYRAPSNGPILQNGIVSSPAIAADGTVYVGSDDYKLYAINPNGTLKWSYTTGGAIVSSPTIAADGTIYVGSWDSKLYAINPNGTLKWSYVTGNGIDSSPAIGADGTIYVGSEDHKLYAINSSSRGLAPSSWPMFRHDLKHTGYVLAPFTDVPLDLLGLCPHHGHI